MLTEQKYQTMIVAEDQAVTGFVVEAESNHSYAIVRYTKNRNQNSLKAQTICEGLDYEVYTLQNLCEFDKTVRQIIKSWNEDHGKSTRSTLYQIRTDLFRNVFLYEKK